MTRRSLLVGALLAGLVVGGGLVAAVGLGPTNPPAGDVDEQETESVGTLATFESEAAFTAYVSRGRASGGGAAVATGAAGAEATGGGDGGASRATADVARQTPAPQATVAEEGGDDGSDDRRVGTTNVQVGGVDEPDIVKTDGRHFFYAPDGRERVRRGGGVRVEPVRTDVARDQRRERPPASTHVIDTSSPAAPEAVAHIERSGKLLQVGESLVVIGDERVTGYDVSDAANPTLSWETELEERLVTARAVDGTVYLVTRSSVGYDDPCPVRPLGSAEIPCTEIHHPTEPVRVDATYSVVALGPASGEVEATTSFVGSARNTVVYASQDSLYLTYTEREGRQAAALEYATTEADVPRGVRERIREIRSYNISTESKVRETTRVLRNWRRSLPEDRRREVQDALTEGFEEWLADRQRQFTRTGIVRVGLDGLAVQAHGEVPGEPLNQFSMSEHDGHLRIATTIPRMGNVESANDLYVLDAASLERVGAEQDMGVTERVYAVRYVDDTAYVVTFRRVDPFHVVDLSDPANPEEVGKLKLPGFSSYLHPVDDDHVLGIGEEDGRVKAVLFDVSDPANPVIDDTLRPDARWSAVAQTHHAFTQDRRHGVFFLPTGEAGLVVDYTNGTLDVETRVTTEQAPSRARVVGDYLYVFAGDTVRVLDETTWEVVSGLDLR